MTLPVLPPVDPMLAKSVPTIPAGKLYEPKWDGFRAIVFRDGDEVVIGSRKERPLTRYFPEVVEAVKRSFPPRARIPIRSSSSASRTFPSKAASAGASRATA